MQAILLQRRDMIINANSHFISSEIQRMQAIQAYERCSTLCPENANAGQNRLLALNYIHPGELPLVCDAHADWGRACQSAITPLPAIEPAEWPEAADGRLRVGYISPDLHRHSVSYFAEAPLLRHDRSAVEVRAQGRFLRSLLLSCLLSWPLRRRGALRAVSCAPPLSCAFRAGACAPQWTCALCSQSTANALRAR